jgi:hypothetical protein
MGVNLASDLHLVLRLTMHGFPFPLPHTCLHAVIFTQKYSFTFYQCINYFHGNTCCWAVIWKKKRWEYNIKVDLRERGYIRTWTDSEDLVFAVFDFVVVTEQLQYTVIILVQFTQFVVYPCNCRIIPNHMQYLLSLLSPGIHPFVFMK